MQKERISLQIREKWRLQGTGLKHLLIVMVQEVHISPLK